MKPIILPANQPPARFYAGGTRISEFRGLGTADPNTPEDWIASVTTVRGEEPNGLTHLPGGSTLASAIESAAVDWLGADHLEAFGTDPNLLVKLLDAGQRLPVHAHPGDAFASKWIGTTHGKAEAWYILRPGEIHLGLTDQISSERLLDLVEIQDITGLLTLMHQFHVEPGDTVFVPPGVLHAIGDGILLVEVQQPEDLSILLEWTGFNLDGENSGHLGLGFTSALSAVEHTSRTREQIEQLIRRAPGAGPVLNAEAEPFFRLDLIVVPDAQVSLPAGYGVVVVLEGHIVLEADDGSVTAQRGTTIVVPASAGKIPLSGHGRALHCRPPAPSSVL